MVFKAGGAVLTTARAAFPFSSLMLADACVGNTLLNAIDTAVTPVAGKPPPPPPAPQAVSNNAKMIVTLGKK